MVVTGAGVSLASGIPTFRGNDPDAVWKKDVTELGTYRFFRSDPVTSWRWSLDLFSKVPGAEPNPGHEALAALQKRHEAAGGRFTLITQNVDTLHEQAGSEDIVKVHGTIDRIRCASDTGCTHGAPSGSLPRNAFDRDAFLADPGTATLPRCPACGDVVRPHVLWFDEYYADHDDYQWPRVQSAARTADLLLFVGTSFSVGVTELFLQAATVQQTPAWSVDPNPAPSYYPVHPVVGASEVVLPEVIGEIEAAGD